MVKLKIAEALQGKSLILIPAATAGSTFNRLDMNKLIDSYKDDKDDGTNAPAAAAPP